MSSKHPVIFMVDTFNWQLLPPHDGGIRHWLIFPVIIIHIIMCGRKRTIQTSCVAVIANQLQSTLVIRKKLSSTLIILVSEHTRSNAAINPRPLMAPISFIINTARSAIPIMIIHGIGMSISVFSVPLPPLVWVGGHIWVGWTRMIREFGLRWWRREYRALIV